jgi:hypothetical protein
MPQTYSNRIACLLLLLAGLIAWIVIGPSTARARISNTTSGEASYSGALFKSTDGGNSWNDITPADGIGIPGSFAIDSKTPSTIYAGARHTGVFKSTDGGESWSLMSAGLPPSFSGYGDIALFDLVIDSKTSSTLYAALARGVYKSTDAGLSWKATGLSGKRLKTTKRIRRLGWLQRKVSRKLSEVKSL